MIYYGCDLREKFIEEISVIRTSLRRSDLIIDEWILVIDELKG